MRPGRKSTTLADRLVLMLNSVLAESSGNNVVRSTKLSAKARSSEFVRFCCKKVGLSDGQIDRAMKRNIADYHRTLEYHNFDLSLGESVDEEQRRERSRRCRPRSRGEL
jgi:hypothetical protein